ncbi:MAG: hypothetical protein KatS3mg003_1159 [Candidatus Nitrosocaldaceae archaeon]|nr:MAG: hypothetical protein KatS3mg003_1159 [Candidatus Nitrosocaldaceae archaeon]
MPRFRVARNIDKDYICLNCKIGKHDKCKQIVSVRYQTPFGTKTRNKECKCLCQEYDYQTIEAIVSKDRYRVECSRCKFKKIVKDYEAARIEFNAHFEKTNHSEVVLKVDDYEG